MIRDIPEDAEAIDVCKAVEEMINESEERGELRMLVKQVKKVVQDLTSGGEDCFPKYTKQFLKHYYDTNEIF